MSETLEGWLLQEIKDAENVVGMYRSYRKDSSPDALSALARLHTLEDVSRKVQELWHLPLPRC